MPKLSNKEKLRLVANVNNAIACISIYAKQVATSSDKMDLFIPNTDYENFERVLQTVIDDLSRLRKGNIKQVVDGK